MTLERTTVHISDDMGRIAMLEVRTVGTDSAPAELSRYIYSNHLGTASLELDENAEIISYEEYHPYGTTAYQAMNSSIAAVAKRYRYTGKERDDETGLYYHGARYYIPWLTRWMAVDPLESKFSPESPYNYCHCNPIMLVDDDGMQSQVKETAQPQSNQWEKHNERGYTGETMIKEVEMAEVTIKGKKKESAGNAPDAATTLPAQLDESGSSTRAGWNFLKHKSPISAGIVKAGYNFGKGIWNMVTHPVTTAINAAKFMYAFSIGSGTEFGQNYRADVVVNVFKTIDKFKKGDIYTKSTMGTEVLLNVVTLAWGAGEAKAVGTIEEAAATAKQTTTVAATIQKALTTFDDVAKYLSQNGQLPSNFITKAQAQALGWSPKLGNLDVVAPGKSIGGDVFKNAEGLLPEIQGRVWREADINYSGGRRGSERLLYSNDGLIFGTTCLVLKKVDTETVLPL